MRKFTFHPLKWHGLSTTERGELAMQVDIHKYPEGMDELVGDVKSQDMSRPGRIAMRVLEAGDNSQQETVRGADSLTFVIPDGYDIENWDPVDMRFYFRPSNSTGFKPEYIMHEQMPPVRDLGLPERNVSENVPEPRRSFLQWSLEKAHGRDHQIRWCRMLLAMAHEWRNRTFSEMEPIWREAEQRGPLSYEECLSLWERHGHNERWSMAKEWFEKNIDMSQEEIKQQYQEAQKRAAEIEFYRNAPAMQGHFTEAEWLKMHGSHPEIVLIMGWGRKGIIDPALGIPNYWLEGEGSATGAWKYVDPDWIDLDSPEANTPPEEVPERKPVLAERPGANPEPGLFEYAEPKVEPEPLPNDQHSPAGPVWPRNFTADMWDDVQNLPPEAVSPVLEHIIEQEYWALINVEHEIDHIYSIEEVHEAEKVVSARLKHNRDYVDRRDNAEVDPGILIKVRQYYFSNQQRPGRGKNWLRVMKAFGDDSFSNDDRWEEIAPYTAKEARESEMIWKGWRPIRKELERLEAL